MTRRPLRLVMAMMPLSSAATFCRCSIRLNPQVSYGAALMRCSVSPFCTRSWMISGNASMRTVLNSRSMSWSVTLSKSSAQPLRWWPLSHEKSHIAIVNRGGSNSLTGAGCGETASPPWQSGASSDSRMNAERLRPAIGPTFAQRVKCDFFILCYNTVYHGACTGSIHSRSQSRGNNTLIRDFCRPVGRKSSWVPPPAKTWRRESKYSNPARDDGMIK